MKSFSKKFLAIGQLPEDSEEEKLHKSGFLLVAGLAILSTIVWGIFNLANGLVLPCLVIFSGSFLWIINIAIFSITKRFEAFANIQLSLLLLIAFASQVSLGGFISSGAVIMWALVAPAGALIFQGIGRSLIWFGSFVVTVLIAYWIDSLLPEYVNLNLSNGFIVISFMMNIIGIASFIFMCQTYFVKKITELNKDIEDKNRELEENSGKLKELDEAKSRFFANISHEFRTPLTLILGLVGKLKTNPQTPPDPKDTDTMKRNAQRLLQLINQLLDLSKLESGELKLQAAKADIVAFAKNLSAQFESMIAGKNIVMIFNGTAIGSQHNQPSIELFFDHEKLQKILTNLLSNAGKFTPNSGKISVEVKTAHELKDVAIIRVSNTGDGIPEDKLPFLFDRFFQVDSESNREYEGTGIGLALVKELVELHRGNVFVESNFGFTSFTVQLPLNSDYLNEDEKLVENGKNWESEIGGIIEIGSSGVKIEGEAVGYESEKDGQLEILIVEDNADLRAFIGSILNNEYHVIEAVDGVDGLEKAETSIPDLIISDVMMPRMDGYELCKQLKTKDKTNHIPVILLTAKASREDKLEGLELGADDYLVKPFDEEELKVRIRNLISIREKLQKKFQGESWQKPKELKVSSVQQIFIEQLKKVIEKNMDNEMFSVDDLGTAMAMSRSQIHRKLKALTDQSATTFIRNYRLHRAADLLKQGAGNVTEIAYQVGFNSQTYFSSSFQELFGCSPSEYKKQTAGSELF